MEQDRADTLYAQFASTDRAAKRGHGLGFDKEEQIQAALAQKHDWNHRQAADANDDGSLDSRFHRASEPAGPKAQLSVRERVKSRVQSVMRDQARHRAKTEALYDRFVAAKKRELSGMDAIMDSTGNMLGSTYDFGVDADADLSAALRDAGHASRDHSAAIFGAPPSQHSSSQAGAPIRQQSSEWTRHSMRTWGDQGDCERRDYYRGNERRGHSHQEERRDERYRRQGDTMMGRGRSKQMEDEGSHRGTRRDRDRGMEWDVRHSSHSVGRSWPRHHSSAPASGGGSSSSRRRSRSPQPVAHYSDSLHDASLPEKREAKAVRWGPKTVIYKSGDFSQERCDDGALAPLSRSNSSGNEEAYCPASGSCAPSKVVQSGEHFGREGIANYEGIAPKGATVVIDDGQQKALEHEGLDTALLGRLQGASWRERMQQRQAQIDD